LDGFDRKARRPATTVWPTVTPKAARLTASKRRRTNAAQRRSPARIDSDVDRVADCRRGKAAAATWNR
jgi:hypothetical protein